MVRWMIGLAGLLLTACASTSNLQRSALPSENTASEKGSTGAIVPADQPPALPDRGLAPELKNEVWLNVDQPLRLADLRGSVVALEMWTFG